MTSSFYFYFLFWLLFSLYFCSFFTLYERIALLTVSDVYRFSMNHHHWLPKSVCVCLFFTPFYFTNNKIKSTMLLLWIFDSDSLIHQIRFCTHYRECVRFYRLRVETKRSFGFYFVTVIMYWRVVIKLEHYLWLIFFLEMTFESASGWLLFPCGC